jgi:hypothetical protein
LLLVPQEDDKVPDHCIRILFLREVTDVLEQNMFETPGELVMDPFARRRRVHAILLAVNVEGRRVLGSALFKARGMARFSIGPGA